MTDPQRTVTVMAGIPELNAGLYWRTRFALMDPCALVDVEEGGCRRTTFIVRDIEMARARAHARADEIRCPRDFAPSTGLSGDRETATAQALAECVRRLGVNRVRADRSLPLLFADQLRQAGIVIDLDANLAVSGRRSKDEQEIAALAEAQRVTEEAIRIACELVGTASAVASGALVASSSAAAHCVGLPAGAPITCESVRKAVNIFLAGEGYEMTAPIVAGGPQGADCHERGTGPLRTGEPVIVDIFPRSRASLYNGDCTRTVVHGAVPPEVARMHAAVVASKLTACTALRAGATGDAVHKDTVASLESSGYPFRSGGPPEGAAQAWCGMVHGTGHGIGLTVHEPPLLDVGGIPLVEGDVVTVEPGLYSRAIGGVRVEDMLVVTVTGSRNLNRLHEGLDWR